MQRPLANQRILVTRPGTQAQKLGALIGERGGTAVLVATLEIAGLPDKTQQRQALARSGEYDNVIFISRHAVHYATALTPLTSLTLPTVLAPGGGTASALQEAGIHTVTTPTCGHHSEALLALPALTDVQGKRLLIIRGQGGRELLRDKLLERGARVDYVEVYQRRLPTDCRHQLQLALAGPLHAIIVGSGEMLDNLLVCLAPSARTTLMALPLFTPSLRVASLATAHGFKQAIPSLSPTPAGFITSLLEWAKTQRPTEANER